MVNIIIPLYKNKDNIRSCLNSLRSQTKRTFIITIVQDYDGEDYTGIIKEFQKDLKIQFIKNEQNLGPGLTRQRGLDLNKMCDYVMFLDSDDMLNPRAVELLYTFAKSNFADVVTSKIIIEKKYGKGFVCQGRRTDSWLHGKIYNFDYLKKNNIRFFEEIRYNEDVAFNLLALHLSEKTFFLDEETYIFRDYKNSITRSDSSKFTKESTWQMIYGYSKGLLRLSKEEKLTKELSISALLTLYTQSQILIEKDCISNNENKLVKEVLILPEIQTALHDKKILEYIATYCKAGQVSNGIIFFHESFDEWIKRLIGLNILEVNK